VAYLGGPYAYDFIIPITTTRFSRYTVVP